MPWFNTTVGLNDSDAEFEAKFKNDADSENDLQLFGTELGKLDVLNPMKLWFHITFVNRFVLGGILFSFADRK